MRNKLPVQKSIKQIGAAQFIINNDLTWIPLFSKDFLRDISNLRLKYGELKDLVLFMPIERIFTILASVKINGMNKRLLNMVRTGIANREIKDTIYCYK